MSSLATALILWYGGGEVIRSQLSLGELVAFFSYMRLFFQPLRELSQKYSIVQSAMASAERIFQLLDTRSRIALAVEPIAKPAVQGESRFDGVRFGYDPENPVLHDLVAGPAAGPGGGPGRHHRLRQDNACQPAAQILRCLKLANHHRRTPISADLRHRKSCAPWSASSSRMSSSSRTPCFANIVMIQRLQSPRRSRRSSPTGMVQVCRPASAVVWILLIGEGGMSCPRARSNCFLSPGCYAAIRLSSSSTRQPRPSTPNRKTS
jgi:hypothetical protein